MKPVIRLTWAVGGFELRFLLAAALSAAGGSLALALLLYANRPADACLSGGLAASQCDSALFFQLGSVGSQFIVGTGLLTLAVGAVLGSQLFARDIERRTVQLPWSLAPSRIRWLAERAFVLVVFVAAVTAVPAVTLTVLEGSIDPQVDATRTLVDFGWRGPSIVARAVAVFAIAALIGLAVGRVLPALLLSGVAAAVVVLAVAPLALATQPTELIAPLGNPEVRYGVVREELYEATNGDLFTIDDVTAKVPSDVEDPTTWIESNFRQVVTGVRGERYWQVEAVSTAMLAAVALSAFAAASVVALRRRPY